MSKKYCKLCAGEMRETSQKSQSGKKLWRCTSCKAMSVNPLTVKPTLIKPLRESVTDKKRYLIGSCLNNAPLNKEWFDCARVIKDKLNAQLIVIPTFYKNLQMTELGIQHAYTWSQECKPYLAPNDLKIGKHLYVRGSVRIPHTAINPLGGLNHAGGTKSEIFGHAQVAKQLVPMPKHMTPKLLHTTGTFSDPVYGPSWTAQKAAFHHSYSALFVETEGDHFWYTQVHWDGKGAFVYNRYFTSYGEKKAKKPSALVLGDLHVRFLSPDTSIAVDKISAKFKPKHTIYHDAHDHHIGSHHSDTKPLFHIEKNADKEFSIRNELLQFVNYIDSANRAHIGQPVVVDSNHHRHLDQWFNRFDPKRDPVNIDLYYELGWMATQAAKVGRPANLLQLFMQKYGTRSVKFVGPDDNFTIHKVDLSQHGDIGPNGSRGSAKAFARTGHKSIIGHGHTPMIEKGCYQVGVLGPGDYATGYSSWLACNVVLASNGKRFNVNLIDDKLPPILRR